MMKTKSSRMIFCFFISLFIISLTLPMPVLGDNLKIRDTELYKLSKDEKIVFQKEEITDEYELRERAINGIIESSKAPIINAVLKEKGSNLEVGNTKTYITVQKIKTKENLKTKEVTDLYRVDSFHLYTLPESNYGISSLELPKEDWDDAYSVVSRVTAYYDQVNTPEGEGYRILSTSGKWTIYDYQVSLSNGFVGWHYNAPRYDLNLNRLTKDTNTHVALASYHPTSGVTYPDPDYRSMDYYCVEVNIIDRLEADSEVIITRGSTSWTGTAKAVFF